MEEGADKAQTHLKDLGWMQTASDHQSWQGKCKAEGLCLYFSLLEMFSWQLCFQSLEVSLGNGASLRPTDIRKPEDPGDSFAPPPNPNTNSICPISNPPNDGTLQLLCYTFSCLGILHTCFSPHFSLTVSVPHLPATPTSGRRFLPSYICVIFCGLSLRRRPLSPKSPHLYPAVVPAHAGSFNNICHSK